MMWKRMHHSFLSWLKSSNFMNSSEDRRLQRSSTNLSISFLNMVSKTCHNGRNKKLQISLLVITISTACIELSVPAPISMWTSHSLAELHTRQKITISRKIMLLLFTHLLPCIRHFPAVVVSRIELNQLRPSFDLAYLLLLLSYMYLKTDMVTGLYSVTVWLLVWLKTEFLVKLFILLYNLLW